MDELMREMMRTVIALAERIEQRERLERLEEKVRTLAEKMELERMFALPSDDRSN